MTLQWIRTVRVVVGTPRATAAVQIGEGFRISFSVGKQDGGKANVCNVRIWGLSATTREQIRQTNSMIQLYAGYGEVVPLLYKGIITRVTIEQEAGELITVIEAKKDFLTISRSPVTPDQAAARALWDQGAAYISRVFDGQTGVVDGLRVIAGDIKSALGEYADQVVEDFERVAAGEPARASRGVRLAGSPQQVLDTYARANNLDIWMEDGIIRAVPRGEASRETAFVLSPTSGLIGSPKPKQSGKAKKATGAVELVCLLNGELRVRRAVQVRDTRELSGWYLIRQVTHKGDSWDGEEYYTHLEATPIKARALAPPPSRARRAELTRSPEAAAAGIGAIEERLGPYWPSYSAARAEVLQWYTQGIWDITPTNLIQIPDGRWTIATSSTVRRSLATGTPPLYPVFRP